MIDGFDTLMLSFVAPLLAKSLQIDHASLGRVFGAGFVGTVLGSLIIGPLADRFGRRKMLVLRIGRDRRLHAGLCIRQFGRHARCVAVSRRPRHGRRDFPDRRNHGRERFVGTPLVAGHPDVHRLPARRGRRRRDHRSGDDEVRLAVRVPDGRIVRAGGHHPGAADPSGSDAGREQRSNRLCRQATVSGDLLARFVGNLFAEGRLAATFALWFGVLASMILSGFLVSFMPTILNLNGVAPDRAALGAVVINVGAIVGALLISLIVRRGAPFVAVAVAFVAGSVMVLRSAG